MSDKKSWRCFHCDEVFTDFNCAKLHFGPSEHVTPACQIDIAAVRQMEKSLAEYRNDDTVLTRQMATERMEHADNVRRAEEYGYAKGLKDYTALEQSKDTQIARLTRELEEVRLVSQNYCERYMQAESNSRDISKDRDTLREKLREAEVLLREAQFLLTYSKPYGGQSCDGVVRCQTIELGTEEFQEKSDDLLSQLQTLSKKDAK